jgi:hypothetical protein
MERILGGCSDRVARDDPLPGGELTWGELEDLGAVILVPYNERKALRQKKDGTSQKVRGVRKGLSYLMV